MVHGKQLGHPYPCSQVPWLLLVAPMGLAFPVSLFGNWSFVPASDVVSSGVDPCASAANLADCHYDQALALLAHLGPSAITRLENFSDAPNTTTSEALPQQGGSGTDQVVNDTFALNQSIGLVPVSNSSIGAGVSLLTTAHAFATAPAEIATASFPMGSVKPTSDVDFNVTADDTPEARVKALEKALDILEGQTQTELDAATSQLEVSLESIQTGALLEFRARHLAKAINAKGPPSTPARRAGQALEALNAAKWSVEGSVAATMRDLKGTASSESPRDSSFIQGLQTTAVAGGGQVLMLVLFGMTFLAVDAATGQAVYMEPQEGYGAVARAV